MLKQGYTEIVCVIDNSESMGFVSKDTIVGINAFLKMQKEISASAALTLILFNSKQNKICDGANLSKVKQFKDSFEPRGQAALLDAIGKTMNDVGERLAATSEEERPEKVIFCILSGEKDNASKQFSQEKIKGMIEHQRYKYSWQFVFLVANQDTYSLASQLGIAHEDTSNFETTPKGIKIACAKMSDMTTHKRKH